MTRTQQGRGKTTPLLRSVPDARGARDTIPIPKAESGHVPTRPLARADNVMYYLFDAVRRTARTYGESNYEAGQVQLPAMLINSVIRTGPCATVLT